MFINNKFAGRKSGRGGLEIRYRTMVVPVPVPVRLDVAGKSPVVFPLIIEREGERERSDNHSHARTISLIIIEGNYYGINRDRERNR